MTQPQIIVTLTPDGSLLVELPGTNGMRRQVPVRDKDAAVDLKRILSAQRSASAHAIGLDSAPTSQQVWHWERHSLIPSRSCPHCSWSKRKSKHKQPSKRTIQLGEGVEVIKSNFNWSRDIGV